MHTIVLSYYRIVGGDNATTRLYDREGAMASLSHHSVLLVTQHVVWPGEVGVSTAGNSHSIFCFAPSYYTFLSIPGQFQFVSNGLSSRSAPEERRSVASWLPPVPARATQPARVTAGCSITINNVLDERMNKYDMENDMENDPITL